MYVDAASGILKIMVERDTTNSGTTTLPPVLPKKLLEKNFGDLLLIQNDRVKETFTSEDLLELENKFRLFKTQTNFEPKFRETIENMSDMISFDDAWLAIRKKYNLLCKFFGGLATVFPGTSTVESDFSVIG